MDASKPILRALSDGERSDAIALRDAVFPNVLRPTKSPPDQGLEKSRIVYQHGGVCSMSSKHLTALAAAADEVGETEAYIHHSIGDSQIGAVDLAALAAFAKDVDWPRSRRGAFLAQGQGWTSHVNE